MLDFGPDYTVSDSILGRDGSLACSVVIVGLRVSGPGCETDIDIRTKRPGQRVPAGFVVCYL